MSNDTISDFIAGLKNHPPSGRSKAYAWLKDHASEIEASFATHRPSWDAVARKLAELGVVEIRNRRLAANNLRRIWQRVCRDLKAERRYQATGVREAPKPIHPSRVPKNWRPEVLSAEPGQGMVDPVYGARASPEMSQSVATEAMPLQPAVYVQQEGEKHWEFIRRITTAAMAKDAEQRTAEEKRAIAMDDMYKRSGHP